MRNRVLVFLVPMVALATSAVTAREDTRTFNGNEALKQFVAAFEPQIPWLIDHYVKNRKITIIRTFFDRAGSPQSKVEYEILSNDTCSRCRVKQIWISETASRSHPFNPTGASVPMDPTGNSAIRPTTTWTIARGDAYFKVVRHDLENKYMITGIGRGFPISEFRQIGEVGYAFIPFSVGGRFYSDLVQVPKFEVLRMAQCELDGQAVTRLDCKDTPDSGVSFITYYFDSKNHWVLRGMDIEWKDRGRKVMTIERLDYGPLHDGVAPLRKIESHMEDELAPSRQVDLYEFVEFTPAHPNASEFSLAQFGLSEKPLIAEPEVSKAFGFHIVLIGGGLLLAGVAIAVYTYARWKPAKAS